MESLIHHFKIVTEGYRVPEGEVYVAVESPRGEFGCYLVSDGGPKPWRVKFRAPSFVALEATATCVHDSLVADMIAIVGSLDTVMGEVDRWCAGCARSAKVDAIRPLPDSRSLSLPALRFAQEEYGWLPPEALREVAEVLDLTPAYCQAVASFYDMFHLEPVGRHMVEVCTNLSCALVGAQRVVEAFEAELGVRAGETTEDGEITFRAVECLGGCGYATVVAVDNRQRLHVKPEDAPRSSRRSVGLLSSLLAGSDERDLTKLEEYRAIGGYTAIEKARAMTPDELIEEMNTSNLRGRGGAGFPIGRKASLIARDSPKPKYVVVNADESEPGAFKDRQVMDSGAAPADRGLPDRRARDRVEGRLHLRPRRVPRRVRDRAGGGRRGRGGRALRRRAARRPPRRRRVHLRRGDRAPRLARGPPRPAAPAPAVPAGAGALRRADPGEQRLHDRDAPDRPRRWAPPSSPKTGAPTAPGTAIFSISGNVVESRQLRARARDADAGADRGPRAAASPTAAS